MEFINAFLFFIFNNTLDNVMVIGFTLFSLWFVWFIAELWWMWINGDFENHGFDASGGSCQKWWR